MSFWLLLLAVTLVIGGIAFFPLWKAPRAPNQTQRNDLNKAFYFDRLQETEREALAGMIDDPEQTKRELQQSLLEDIPTEPEARSDTRPSPARHWFILLIMLLGAVGVGVYSQVGSWQTHKMLDLSHQKLSYFYERIQHEESNPLTDQEMAQFAMALRVEVQQKPQDDRAWFMLGQAGMATEDWKLALDSFAQANRLEPHNPLYALRYAQTLLFSDDPKDKERGEELIKEVIRLDHSNTEALGLLAFRLFEKEDYKMAAATWEMMLKLLPENDPRRATIERSMASALGKVQ